MFCSEYTTYLLLFNPYRCIICVDYEHYSLHDQLPTTLQENKQAAPFRKEL
jgi:hypothetical protein